jgi:hypothetical protein
LGVATFTAAAIGGASNIAEPARDQRDLGVAVQRRVECDVVTCRVDVSQCEAAQWQEVGRPAACSMSKSIPLWLI